MWNCLPYCTFGKRPPDPWLGPHPLAWLPPPLSRPFLTVYSPLYWHLQGKVDMSVAIVPMSAEAGWSASVSGLVQVGCWSWDIPCREFHLGITNWAF